ncbi:hypothetical protein ACOZ4I_15230 [Haloarcula salina]|uniref:hypothetical protein n=1 Tax=Haloarcula salina TaxID=1429914 RepID=UPI003C6FDF55
MQRRAFLTAAGVAYVSGLGGCVSSDEESRSPEHTTSSAEYGPTPTEGTQTSTDVFSPSASELSFTANVLNQATTEEPPSIEIALINNATEPIEIEYGAALLFSDDSGSTEWGEEIAIEPESSGANLGSNPERTDGCWSVASDTYLEIISIADFITLNPGDQFTETVFVYSRSETDECYPAGTYRFEDRLRFTSTDSQFEVALQISVGSNGEIAASGEQPYPVTD